MKGISMVLALLLLGNLSYAQHFSLDSKQFKVGDVYVSNPKITFDFAKWTISTINAESRSHLDSIAEFLLKHDSLIVEIGVHTDNRRSDNYSMRLDKKKAVSIMEFLIHKGVDSERLSAKGYGISQLIVSDLEIEKTKTQMKEEEAHAINRRTTIKLMAITQTPVNP